jgi:hypothetical protein
MIELAQLMWLGNAVKMGDERYPKIAWKTGKMGKRPNGRPRQPCEERILDPRRWD